MAGQASASVQSQMRFWPMMATGWGAPEAIMASDIERILDELGGLGHVLSTAEPTEKALVYASLGLRLRYQPGENRVVATADLGRVLSGVGGKTRTLTPHPLGRGTYDTSAA